MYRFEGAGDSDHGDLAGGGQLHSDFLCAHGGYDSVCDWKAGWHSVSGLDLDSGGHSPGSSQFESDSVRG